MYHWCNTVINRFFFRLCILLVFLILAFETYHARLFSNFRQHIFSTPNYLKIFKNVWCGFSVYIAYKLWPITLLCSDQPKVVIFQGQELRPAFSKHWPRYQVMIGRDVHFDQSYTWYLAMGQWLWTFRPTLITACVEAKIYPSCPGCDSTQHDTFSQCWANVGPASQVLQSLSK